MAVLLSSEGKNCPPFSLRPSYQNGNECSPPKTKKIIAFAYQAALLRRVFLYRDGPRRGSFLRSSSKALARPFGSRMLWELDRGATRPCKLPHKHLCFTIRQPAPAGVSQACGLAMPNAGFGAGHDTAHPTHSRVVTPRPVSVHPICSGAQGMCGGPGPVLSLHGHKITAE